MFNVLLLETHARCNRKCWFCKHGQERQDKRSDSFVLGIGVLTKIAKELRTLNYTGRISLFGINEPLLDVRIARIIELFREHVPGAYITLNTNGDFLTEEKLEELLIAGLSAIGISIYEDASFKRFAHLKRHPRVALLDMRQPIGKVENRGGTILRNIEVFDPQRFQTTPCLRPSNMMVIKATGKAVLCCSDQYGDVELGDVRNCSLMEIWQSPNFEALRQQLQQGQRKGLKLCEKCSHRGSTSPVHYPLSHSLR